MLTVKDICDQNNKVVRHRHGPGIYCPCTPRTHLQLIFI